MAMIRCPECGHAVSDCANTCTQCGYPLNGAAVPGVVKIKMPVAHSLVSTFSACRAEVIANSKTVWEGTHGDNACFTVSGPTKVIINLGRWANTLVATVYPRKNYVLVPDEGFHILGTYRLQEVRENY